MDLVGGSLDDVAADRAVTRRLRALVAETGRPALRTWRPPAQVAFGRRDTIDDGYETARRVARDRGFPLVERDVGGRAVAFTGDTVAVAFVFPAADERDGIRSRYRDVRRSLRRAFLELGVDARPGEPAGAFCPGSHSLQCDGKLAGLAQRVGGGTAVVGGCVVVTAADTTAIAAVLEPVYDALGIPLDPDAVGSLETAGAPDDPDAVVAAIETAFAGAHGETERRHARDLLA